MLRNVGMLRNGRIRPFKSIVPENGNRDRMMKRHMECVPSLFRTQYIEVEVSPV